MLLSNVDIIVINYFSNPKLQGFKKAAKAVKAIEETEHFAKWHG